MKKVAIMFLSLLMIFGLAGCKESVAKKEMEQGKSYVESKEYDKALSSFELVLKDDPDNNEAKTIIDIIKGYKSANDSLAKKDVKGLKSSLEGISSEYSKYRIKDDIDKLKSELETLESNIANNDKSIKSLETLLSEKKYSEGKALVDELNKKDLTNEQVNKVKELSDKITAEVAKAEEAKKAEAKKTKEEASKSKNLTENQARDKVASLKEVKRIGKFGIMSSSTTLNGMKGYQIEVGDNGEETWGSRGMYFVNSKNGNIYRHDIIEDKYELVRN